jgi:orotate phosphoribosyltransferase
MKTVRKLEGNIIGIGVLLDRSEQKKDFDVPLFSCLSVTTTIYKPAECPLCAAGIPLVKPGGSQT